MIQELFAGASLISAAERNSSINNNGGAFLPPHTSPCPPSTTTTTTTTTTSNNNNNNNNNTPNSTTSENQNLRCPRCDSSNTKFCYYNNYNLTQPRHFCKTCRRYWTKGGALRNVPIGGGCRKNKTIGVSSSAVKATTTKLKSVASEFGRPGLISPDHLPSTPILWGSPQNTHLLALLRANQTPNSNPNPNPSHMMGTQSHMVTTEPLVSTGMLNNNPRTLSYDSMGQVPSLGLCSSLWRNNQDQPQQQNGGFLLGEHQNSGIQELYQKLRSSSSANYCTENSPVFLGTVASNSSTISNILESNSVAGGEFGYWNPTLSSWSDLPTTHGAYP